MKIRSVTIQNMHNVVEKTYEFSDTNYISGKNGAGKSTILQAIQLAILGYIPGYNKRNSDIMKHSNADTMLVKVVFDTDDYITRKYTRLGSSINSMVDSSFGDGFDLVKELEMPIYNFSSFLDMSPNEQKKWFISYLPKSDTNINWEEDLKSEIENLPEYSDEIFNDIMSGINQRGLNDVNDIYDYMKSMVSFVNGQIKAKNSVLSDMSYYKDINLDEEDDVKEELSSKQQELMYKQNALDNFQSYVLLKEELKDYKASLKADTKEEDEEYITLTVHIAEIDEEIKKLNEEFNSKSSEWEKVIRENRDNAGEVVRCKHACDVTDICPIIPNDIHCDKIVKYKDECIKKYNDAEAKYESSLEQENSISSEVDEISSKLDELQADKRESEGRKLRIDMNYELYATKLDSFNKLFSSDDDLSKESEDDLKEEITLLQQEVDELQDELSKINANKKYAEIKAANSLDLSKYENELIVLKKLQEYTGPNGLQQELLYKPFIDLQEDITEYLKQMFNDDNVSCYMNLSSKSNSFEFGIIRNNVEFPFTVLSSGEKCMYMLALQSSILARNPLGLETLMIDDVFDHLDEKNISLLVEAIMNTDIQYIIAGVAIIPEDKKFDELNRIKL